MHKTGNLHISVSHCWLVMWGIVLYDGMVGYDIT